MCAGLIAKFAERGLRLCSRLRRTMSFFSKFSILRA
jgi:hypothetical protein